ncbi:MAG: hypothetical protein AAF568_04010 [Pseudomonadota bacterium]
MAQKPKAAIDLSDACLDAVQGGAVVEGGVTSAIDTLNAELGGAVPDKVAPSRAAPSKKGRSLVNALHYPVARPTD